MDLELDFDRLTELDSGDGAIRLVLDGHSRGERKCARLHLREAEAFQTCLAASSGRLNTTKRVRFLGISR